MTTHQSLVGGTFSYNATASWFRNHQARIWAITTETSFRPAVIDDFGALVSTSWSVTA